MLLVDHGERQIGESDILLKQRMGADGDVGLPAFEPMGDPLAGLALLAPGEQRGADAGGLAKRRDGFKMLAGENSQSAP